MKKTILNRQNYLSVNTDSCELVFIIPKIGFNISFRNELNIPLNFMNI